MSGRSGRPPRVTIGMPVFNGERHLDAALESALAQTFTDFELVISDNASTDATPDICRAHAARDPRVRYVRQPRNLGAAPNYNLLVDMARGEFFRWAAHDDLGASTLLARLVEALDRDPHAVLSFSDALFIDDEGASIRHHVDQAPWHGGSASVRLRDLLGHAHSHLHRCLPVFGLMRTDALRCTSRIGAFESSDKVLLVELALAGDFARVPERLFSRREHARSSRRAQVTSAERARWFDTSARAGRPMVRTTLARHYARAVRRARIPTRERMRCAVTLMRWLATGRRWRVIAGECTRAAGARLTRPAVVRQA